MNRTIALLLLPLLSVACGDGDSHEGHSHDGATASHPQTPEAMAKGVKWLREQADDQGRYSMTLEGDKVPNPGYTALALAPIVAALPADERKNDPLVKKSVAYLLSMQQENGSISSDMFRGYENYLTSATLMSLSLIDDDAHTGARKKMTDYLLSLQRMEKDRHEGGFGYNKRGGADLSNAQFTIEALHAAGIGEDHPAMKRAREYLSRAQNRSENEANAGKTFEIEDEKRGKVKVVPGNDGSAGYEPGVSKAGLVKLPDGTYVARGYGSMTYALLKSYILAGLKADDPRLEAAIDWLGKNYSWDENPGFEEMAKIKKDAPYQGLYYYYMTAGKALDLADDAGAKLDSPLDGWRSDLTGHILDRQSKDGSWVNDKSERWDEGNAVLCTCYALLALQAANG